MPTRKQDKVTVTWRELSEMLSKAEVLLGDEDIQELTLTRPRSLLIHTIRVKETTEE